MMTEDFIKEKKWRYKILYIKTAVAILGFAIMCYGIVAFKDWREILFSIIGVIIEYFAICAIPRIAEKLKNKSERR